MTYIERINKFWVSHEGNQFSTTEIALYFYLLKVANLCSWPDSIKRNNAKICADLGVSFNTLAQARNKLRQARVIDFKTKNGAPNVTYTLSNFDEVTNEVADEVTNEVGREVTAEVADELNKSKEVKVKRKELTPSSPHEISSSPKRQKEQPVALKFPFNSSLFISTWEQLATMPKWRKKITISLQMALDKLGKYQEEFAVELMRRAIEGGYQGVVFSDTDQAYGRWLKSRGNGQILTPESESKKSKLLMKLDGN